MKFLIYTTPWIEMGRPHYLDPCYNSIDNNEGILINIINSLLSSGVKKEDLLIISGEAQQKIIEDNLIKDIRRIVISQKEMREFVPDDITWYKKLYCQSPDNEFLNNIANFFKKKIGNFKPDFILPYSSPVPFFKCLYPDAVICTSESGFFGDLGNIEKTTFLDCFGTTKNSYIYKYKNELRDVEISKNDKIHLEYMRSQYLSVIDKNSPFKDIIGEIKEKKKLKYYLLFPMQQNNHFLTKCDLLQTQEQKLFYVLENLPSDIGLIVTQPFTLFYGNILNTSLVSFLEKKYSNFIYHTNFEIYQKPSVFLLPYIDGTIGHQTSMANHTIFVDKPFFSISDSYTKTFSEDIKLTDIKENLNSRNFKNKDNMINYLLKHYYILKSDLKNPEFVSNFFYNTFQKNKEEKNDFNFYLFNEYNLKDIYSFDNLEIITHAQDTPEVIESHWKNALLALEAEKSKSKMFESHWKNALLALESEKRARLNNFQKFLRKILNTCIYFKGLLVNIFAKK